MENILTEEELIEYAKPFLKSRKFKKKNKRWTKDIGDFTIIFFIQGSCYDKNDYYIRPGIFINALPAFGLNYYGHFHTELKQTTAEEVMNKFEKWYTEWTDKELIKERVLKFIEWDKRNPLENRRAGLVDYDADPCPAYECFSLSEKHIQYILSEF